MRFVFLILSSALLLIICLCSVEEVSKDKSIKEAVSEALASPPSPSNDKAKPLPRVHNVPSKNKWTTPHLRELIDTKILSQCFFLCCNLCILLFWSIVFPPDSPTAQSL